MSEVIAHILDRSDADKIIVWTVQHKEVLATLVSKGIFKADYCFVPSHRLAATKWMATEMMKKGLLTGEAAPVWVFLSKPKPKSDPVWGEPLTEDHVLLCLSIPKGRMLISFHWAWAYVILPGYPRFPLFWNLEAHRRFSELPQIPSDAECQRSWQNIFDLELIHAQGFTWWTSQSASSPPPDEDLLLLQATVPFLLASDLSEVLYDW